MSKFRKIAAIQTKFPKDLSGLFKMLTSEGDDLTDILNKENIKQNLIYLASLFPGWSDRYSYDAIPWALETDKPRGYKGTKHSQGAFENLSPELLKKIEEFKKNPSKDMKDLLTDKPLSRIENINVPETSDRYKAMREKLYPTLKSEKSNTATSNSEDNKASIQSIESKISNASINSNKRFIKTSETYKAEDIQKLLPNWTIEEVLVKMSNEALRTDLSNDNQKRLAMINVLREYEESIAPLSNFLKKYDVKYK